MHINPWRLARASAAAVLVTVFAAPRGLLAETSPHVVSQSDLAKATVDASQARQKNLDTLNGFLSTAQAEEAMKIAHANPQEVQRAVASLSDQELAQLASRANEARSNFAAGNITNHDLLVIMVGILALILIIVAVH
jgi:hypothetical protein